MQPVDDLASTTVIVTGASRGIGRATARHLARRGATSDAARYRAGRVIRADGGRAISRENNPLVTVRRQVDASQ